MKAGQKTFFCASTTAQTSSRPQSDSDLLRLALSTTCSCALANLQQIDRRLQDVVAAARVGRGRSIIPVSSSPSPSPPRSNRGPQHPRQQEARSDSRQRPQTSNPKPYPEGEGQRTQPSHPQVRFQTLSASDAEEIRRLARDNKSPPPRRSTSRDTSSQRGPRQTPPFDGGRRRSGSLDLPRQLERDSAIVLHGRSNIREVEEPLTVGYRRAQALVQNLSITSSQQGRRVADSASQQPRGSSSTTRQDGASTAPSQPRASMGTNIRHEEGCRCLVCFPENYTQGRLLSMWETECASGCLCPRCLATKQPVSASLCCQNQGHMLPKEQRCAISECACKVGCHDPTCPRCYPIPLLPHRDSPVSEMLPTRQPRSVRGGVQSGRPWKANR